MHAEADGPGSGRAFGGAVLAGGRSRRMGRDKSLIEIGGEPMAGVAARALSDAGAAFVVAVGGDLDGLRRRGLAAVADDHPGEGPLGAILTALRHGTDRGVEAVVVLSCDLPRARGEAVRAVVDVLCSHPAADAAMPLVDGRWEPLHAAWRVRCLDVLVELFGSGERAPRRAIECLDVVPVTGIERSMVAGVNTPQEVAAAHVLGTTAGTGHTGRMSDSPHLPEITVDELADRQGSAWILDVRQPDEYEAGHVPGAVLIPLDELGDRHGEVPRDAQVYVICKSGGRSAAAVEALNGAGCTTANVAGGTMAWIEAGHAVVTGPEAR